MEWDTRQKNLLIILARDLASRVVTPMFVVDAQGTLVFFNEAAESVLGRSYSDCGEMKAEEWASAFEPTDPDGRPLELHELPLGIAFGEGTPAHRSMNIVSGSGQNRSLAVTAFPLLAHAGELVGAVALFWDQDHPGS